MVASPAGGTEPRTQTGRNLELILLGASSIVVAAALIIVEAAQSQGVSWDLAKYFVAYLVLFGAAHLMVRRFAPHADPLILPIVATLNGLGLVIIHRLDLGSGNNKGGEAASKSSDANQQVLWTVLGLVIFGVILAVLRDHRTLSRYSYLLGIGGIIFLAIPIVLPSSMSEINGSKNWIKTGVFNIQPGEFSKILIIIFTAALLVAKRDLFTTAGKHFLGMDLPRLRDLAPLLIAWVVAIGVFAIENDLGQPLLIFATILSLLYVATERISWVVIGVVLFAAGAILAYQLFPHLQVRVQIWNDPFKYFNDIGYQPSQALFGLATGGLFGTGLGSGRPNIVPFANTDFIISSIGEELGLVGLAAILMLYLVLVSRGLRTGITVRDSFGKLLATGLAFSVAAQLFVIVGGVTKLIPLTGVTTPFLSYGGSSLLANYILVAILLRISNAAREPDTAKPAGPNIASANTQIVRRA